MRRLLPLILALALGGVPALAGTPSPAASVPDGCAGAPSAAASPTIQLAQSGCRGDCSSRRGYCLSSCRDGDRQCRAICNDLYRSCLSSCRR